MKYETRVVHSHGLGAWILAKMKVPVGNNNSLDTRKKAVSKSLGVSIAYIAIAYLCMAIAHISLLFT